MSSTPFFDQWENIMSLLSQTTFPSHLRVLCPDTIFFDAHNYPSSHFHSSRETLRLQSKTSSRLTLDQVCDTLVVKIRAAESKLAEHLDRRKNVPGSRPSPVATPPTVKIALTGAFWIDVTDDDNKPATQNSRTLLLSADQFEEQIRRWKHSEVEKKRSMPRCLQLINVAPETGASYLTCFMQSAFSNFSITCRTYQVKLETRLGMVAEKSTTQVLKEMTRVSPKDSVAVRLKRTIVGIATQLGKAPSKKNTKVKVHGLVVEFIVTEQSHVELIRVLGSHFRDDIPSWSNPKRTRAEQKRNRRKHGKSNVERDLPTPVQRTQDDLLASALMSSLYSESPVEHSKRIDNGGSASAAKTAARQSKSKNQSSRRVSPVTTMSVQANEQHQVERSQTSAAVAAKKSAQPTKPTKKQSTSSHQSNKPTKPGRILRQRPAPALALAPVPVHTAAPSATVSSAPPSMPRPAKDPKLDQENKQVIALKQQIAAERTSMLRALSEAQNRGDALAQHMESQQRQLREIRSQLLVVTDRDQQSTRDLDLFQREASSMRGELRTLQERVKVMSKQSGMHDDQINLMTEVTNKLLLGSGVINYVQRDVLSFVPVSNDQPEDSSGIAAENELLSLRLNVLEKLPSLKRCFVFFGTLQVGMEWLPKNMRVQQGGAEKLLQQAGIISKTFTQQMGTRIFSSVSKSKKSVRLGVSAGATFTQFIIWLIQLSQIRYRRFQITTGERFSKLITKNIDVALVNMPDNLHLPPPKTWLPGHLLPDGVVKEKWLPHCLDSTVS